MRRIASRARIGWRLINDEVQPFVALDLDNQWESYRVFFAPINWRFRSGDRFEVNINPVSERLVAPFEVSDGIVIPPGRYHWKQYRLEVATAQKRRLYAQVTWWFGGFYTGWAGVALRSRWLISSRMSVPHRLPAVHRVLAALVAVAMPVLSALAVIRAPNG